MNASEPRPTPFLAARLGLHHAPALLPAGQDVEVTFRLRLPSAATPEQFAAWLRFMLGAESVLDADNPLCGTELDAVAEPFSPISARLRA